MFRQGQPLSAAVIYSESGFGVETLDVRRYVIKCAKREQKVTAYPGTESALVRG